MKRFDFTRLVARLRLTCFEFCLKHAKCLAIISTFMWLICAIAAGARA